MGGHIEEANTTVLLVPDIFTVFQNKPGTLSDRRDKRYLSVSDVTT